MKKEQFLVDYFPSEATVTVNACELQGTLKDKQRLERVNQALRDRVESLEGILAQLRLDRPIHIDLKG